MLPFSSDVLRVELEGIRIIVDKWLEKPIPGEEEIGGEKQLHEYLRQLYGELRVCAGKCANLADIIWDTSNSG